MSGSKHSGEGALFKSHNTLAEPDAATTRFKATSCEQRIEVGDAIHPKDIGLAVDDEVLLPVLQSILGDQGISPGPVTAVAGQQAHAFVLTYDQHPVAVVFHTPARSSPPSDGSRRAICAPVRSR
jgi:hypothetical protein